MNTVRIMLISVVLLVAVIGIAGMNAPRPLSHLTPPSSVGGTPSATEMTPPTIAIQFSSGVVWLVFGWYGGTQPYTVRVYNGSSSVCAQDTTLFDVSNVLYPPTPAPMGYNANQLYSKYLGIARPSDPAAADYDGYYCANVTDALGNTANTTAVYVDMTAYTTTSTATTTSIPTVSSTSTSVRPVVSTSTYLTTSTTIAQSGPTVSTTSTATTTIPSNTIIPLTVPVQSASLNNINYVIFKTSWYGGLQPYDVRIYFGSSARCGLDTTLVNESSVVYPPVPWGYNANQQYVKIIFLDNASDPAASQYTGYYCTSIRDSQGSVINSTALYVNMRSFASAPPIPSSTTVVPTTTTVLPGFPINPVSQITAQINSFLSWFFRLI